MKPRHKRLSMIAVGVAPLGVMVVLVLSAFQKNLVFFITPSQVAANEAPQGRTFRIGGLVELGSVERQSDGVTVRFVMTDTANSIPVFYRGVPLDLFREGKGVATQGRLDPDGVFRPSEVLAKHDGNCMPPEAAAIAKARAGNPPGAATVVVPAGGR